MNNKYTYMLYKGKKFDSSSIDKDPISDKDREAYLKSKHDYLKHKSPYSKYLESAELICDDENEETWKVVINAALFICDIHGVNESCKQKYLSTLEECKS